MAGKNGTFLYSLEPELNAHPQLVSDAILVAGLFSRQVCLTDTHLFESDGVRWFFKVHERELTVMLRELESNEIPLFGSCSQRGSDIMAALDLFLTPKSADYPNYFTCLSPSKNVELRKRYTALKTPDGRRNRLFRIAGTDYKLHVERLRKYFEHDRTTIERSGSPEVQLYPSVTSEVTALCDLPNALTDDEDKRIAEVVLDTIAKHRRDAPQTRDLLHRMIYGGQHPPVYQGKVESDRGTATPTKAKNEWRFLINSIYNHNLAASLRLRPVLNSSWWPIGRRWLAKFLLERELELQQAGSLPLAVPLYRDYLTIEFVLRFRKKFAKDIASLEDTLVTGDADQSKALFRDHVALVSQEFAEYLIGKRAGHLVGRTLTEAGISCVSKASFAAGPVLMGLAYYLKLPAHAAMHLWNESVGIVHMANFAVEQLFPVSGDSLRRVRGPAFKCVISDITAASGLLN